MTSEERRELVAPCGIDCGICELYLCRDDARLEQYLIARGIPAERLPCSGCVPGHGDCPVVAGTCATWTCAQEHGVRFCFECTDFPCEKLSPAADRADVLPHNTKVFDLSVIERRGVDGFIAESAVIKARYFKGTMEIGRGPRLAAPTQPPEEL